MTKKEALKRCKGDFDKTLTLATDNREELSWWIDNEQDSYNNVCTSKPDVVVNSDVSLTGWGCDCEGVHSGGQWLPAERMYHRNYLELKAVFFVLQCFLSKLQNKHVRLMIDNTMAVACINTWALTIHCLVIKSHMQSGIGVYPTKYGSALLTYQAERM